MHRLYKRARARARLCMWIHAKMRFLRRLLPVRWRFCCRFHSAISACAMCDAYDCSRSRIHIYIYAQKSNPKFVNRKMISMCIRNDTRARGCAHATNINASSASGKKHKHLLKIRSRANNSIEARFLPFACAGLYYLDERRVAEAKATKGQRRG